MNNFVLRTLVGILFLVVMVAGILLDPLAFAALFLLIMLQAMREFYIISLGERMKWHKLLAYVCAAAVYMLVFSVRAFSIDPAWIVLGIVPLLLIPVVSIFSPDHSDFADVSLIYAALLYIAAPVCLVPLLVIKGDVFDGTLLLSLFILIWVSDVGAYCLGTMFGQKPDSRKLAPSISPKKSWWGFWGAVVLGVAAAIGLHYLTWLPYSLVHCAVIGAIVSVAAVCGDLVESLWKRYYHVKDSGNCIPGHGGMLDRFDSSFIAIPMAAAYITLISLL